MKINQESKISQQMPRTRWFHGKLYQIFKEELIPIHFKLLQKKKKKEEETLPNSYKASILWHKIQTITLQEKKITDQ